MASFVPKPARVRVRISGVDVLDLKASNDAARALVRAVRDLQKVASASDEDIVDALTAAAVHEAQTIRGNP